jgi:uncharacterized protein (TIGR00725 family)
MPIDPVCRREVDLRTAHSTKIVDGRAYYFCCAACAEAYLADPKLAAGAAPPMRLTVGVMGSAGDDETEHARTIAYALGEAIADRGFILITGACHGLPYHAARGAKAAGGQSVGVSPALSLHEHLYRYNSPADAFDVLIYTGSGLMGREVTNIRSSDMVVVLGGRSGTLGEFAIAFDEGKLIGVLQGTGGVADDIAQIVTSFDKETGARLLYGDDPVDLMDRLSGTFESTHFRRPSVFSDVVSGAADQADEPL